MKEVATLLRIKGKKWRWKDGGVRAYLVVEPMVALHDDEAETLSPKVEEKSPQIFLELDETPSADWYFGGPPKRKQDDSGS